MIAQKSRFCEICLNPSYGKRCKSCRDWERYWASLSPEEKLAEQEAMDRYGSDEADA